MFRPFLSCALLLGFGVSFLRAGTVVSLANNVETVGTLSVTSGSIHVDTGASPTGVNLSDVLEAEFGETPFTLDVVVPGKGTDLPAGWKAQDIGAVANPGKVTVSDGTFVLGGGGILAGTRSLDDGILLVGQPWQGDGQWSAKVSEINSQFPATLAGLTIRDTLSPVSMMLEVDSTAFGNGRIRIRGKAGRFVAALPAPTDPPVWLRLSRYGNAIVTSFSTDGAAWNIVARQEMLPMANPWVGLLVSSQKNKDSGHATFSDVCFSPPPSSAQVLPPGVLLQDGSFLAGYFERLSLDPTATVMDGRFMRNGKPLAVSAAKIAAVLLLPTGRSQIADMSSRVGVLMRNGDTFDGTVSAVDRDQVIVSSVVLGITTCRQSEVAGCFFQPVQPQPGIYEIRLKDGSDINAAGLICDAQNAVITTVGGQSVTTAVDEIAQIRAGSSLVENLALLSWQATPSSPAPRTWEGPNQQQIIEAPIGTTLDFPLSDKFRAMGMRIAVSSDSRPDANITVRVLADGKEIGRTLPFKAGDQPRFVEVALQHPRTLSLEADSVYAGTKVYFIDPVAIRDKTP